ncbi:unnamed protein product [Ixodes persulcatus]
MRLQKSQPVRCQRFPSKTTKRLPQQATRKRTATAPSNLIPQEFPRLLVTSSHLIYQHLETIHTSTTERGSARRRHICAAVTWCTPETSHRLWSVPTTVSGLASSSYGYAQHLVTCPSTF